MRKDNTAEVELLRFDPGIDKRPWYQFFKVPYKGHTVLSVLIYIHHYIDSSIAFRWCCDKGYCRSCVICVNGEPVFACNKSAEKYMKIEPHPKFIIIKDLVVDLNTPKNKSWD